MNESFGKNLLITVFMISVPLACAADRREDYKAAIEYAYQQAREAEVKLDEKAKTCHIKKKLDAATIKGQLPSIPNDQLKLGIGFLAYRNFLRCVYPEDARLLYALHSVERLIEGARDRGFDVDPTAAEYTTLRKSILGSPTSSLLEAEYMAIPEATRKKFDAIEELQTQDYNAVKLLEELGLLKDLKQSTHPGDDDIQQDN